MFNQNAKLTMNRMVDRLCHGANRAKETPYDQGKADFYRGVENSPFPMGDSRRKQYYDGYLDARFSRLLDKSVATTIVAEPMPAA
jgi:hypothetical protein